MFVTSAGQVTSVKPHASPRQAGHSVGNASQQVPLANEKYASSIFSHAVCDATFSSHVNSLSTTCTQQPTVGAGDGVGAGVPQHSLGNCAQQSPSAQSMNTYLFSRHKSSESMLVQRMALPSRSRQHPDAAADRNKKSKSTSTNSNCIGDWIHLKVRHKDRFRIHIERFI